MVINPRVLNSIDVVIDLVVGKLLDQYVEIIKPCGRYTVAGAIGGPDVQLDVRTLYLKDLSMFGCTQLSPGVFNNLIQAIEQERIVPVVARTFALENIRKAQEMFMDKKFVGKIVLEIETDDISD